MESGRFVVQPAKIEETSGQSHLDTYPVGSEWLLDDEQPEISSLEKHDLKPGTRFIDRIHLLSFISDLAESDSLLKSILFLFVNFEEILSTKHKYPTQALFQFYFILLVKALKVKITIKLVYVV